MPHEAVSLLSLDLYKVKTEALLFKGGLWIKWSPRNFPILRQNNVNLTVKKHNLPSVYSRQFAK